MQRTFIALKVFPQCEMMDCIQHLRNVLRKEKIKWVDMGNLHITLRFLGDCSPLQVRKTGTIMEKAVAVYPAPEVVFVGLGLFRNIRDPKVLWIGMDPGKILSDLKDRIDRDLSGIGFPAEERKFRPHLTLARIKHIRDRDVLYDQLMEYKDAIYQKVQIKEVIYFESILRSEGPSYLPLKKVFFD